MEHIPGLKTFRKFGGANPNPKSKNPESLSPKVLPEGVEHEGRGAYRLAPRPPVVDPEPYFVSWEWKDGKNMETTIMGLCRDYFIPSFLANQSPDAELEP